MESSLVPDAPEEDGTFEETVPATGDGPVAESPDDPGLDENPDDGSDLRDDRAEAAIEPPFTLEEDADLLG